MSDRTGPSELPSPEIAMADLDRVVARFLTIGTYASVALLTTAVVAMALAGRSPTVPQTFPSFDPGRLLPDLAAGRPEGFLWLGLLAVIATPTARVVASLAGYVRTGERRMAVISVLIVVVMVTIVVVGIATGGTAG